MSGGFLLICFKVSLMLQKCDNSWKEGGKRGTKKDMKIRKDNVRKRRTGFPPPPSKELGEKERCKCSETPHFHACFRLIATNCLRERPPEHCVTLSLYLGSWLATLGLSQHLPGNSGNEEGSSAINHQKTRESFQRAIFYVGLLGDLHKYLC